MNELINTRTPEVIAAEIRALTSTVLCNIIEIGRRFTEAKALIPHGQFGQWLEESTGYSQRTARNFMKLYDAYGDQQYSLFGAQTNRQTFSNLPYSKALALLSVPEEEREAFAEEVHADEISVRELKAEIAKREEERDRAIEDLDAAKEDLKEMSERLDDAQTTVDRLSDELDELQNRPVEVAVREPSKEELDAIVADRLRESDEIHAKVLASADEARRKVETDLAKSRQDLKAMKDKLKNAEADHQKALEQERVKAADAAKAEAAQTVQALKGAEAKVRDLSGQLEAAEKKLAMSDEAVTTFKVHFSAWQRDHAAMLEAMAKAPPELVGNLRSAIRAQMDAWEKEAR